jgi:predicted phosphoribosyltransferase
VNGYRDREAAGEALAAELSGYGDRPDVLVLGLVRGGVPVAARVARALHAPLDVLVVRKLGVPWSPEVGFGALGPGGVRVLNRGVADRLDDDDVDRVSQEEGTELARREARYRAGRPPLDLTGRTAILVDDGLATGATAAVAVEVARRLGANRTVLAAPVGSTEAVAWLREVADEVVCPLVPPDFGAVSRFYQDFPQTSDDEVAAFLAA